MEGGGNKEESREKHEEYSVGPVRPRGTKMENTFEMSLLKTVGKKITRESNLFGAGKRFPERTIKELSREGTGGGGGGGGGIAIPFKDGKEPLPLNP